MRPVDEEGGPAAGVPGFVEAVRRQSGSPGPAQLTTVEASCADLADALGRLGLDGSAPLPVETVAGLADGLLAARTEAPVPAEGRAAVQRLQSARERLEALREEVRRAEADPDNVTGVPARRLVRRLGVRGTR